MTTNTDAFLERVAYYLAHKHKEVDYEPGCNGLVISMVLNNEVNLYGKKELVKKLLNSEVYFEFKGNSLEHENVSIYHFNLNKFLETDEGKQFLKKTVDEANNRLRETEEELLKFIEAKILEINNYKERLICFQKYQ